jgi:hypothetical protein
MSQRSTDAYSGRPRILLPCPQLNPRSPTLQQDKKYPRLIPLPVKVKHIVRNVVGEYHVQKDDLVPPRSDFRNPPQSKNWKLDAEAEEELRQIFNELDANVDEILSENERETGQKRLDAFLIHHGVTMDGLRQRGDMTYEEFKHAVEKERELTRKAAALSSLEILRIIARVIPGGNMDKPLLALELMNPIQISHLCRFVVAHELEAVVTTYHDKAMENPHNWGVTQRDGNTDETEGNTKFALQEAVFGKIEEYHKGIIDSLGYPNTDLLRAMEHEHCKRADSGDKFKPGNYQSLETWPEE